jgi:hypothetical protein
MLDGGAFGRTMKMRAATVERESHGSRPSAPQHSQLL